MNLTLTLTAALTLSILPAMAAHDHFAVGIVDTFPPDHPNGLPDAGEPLQFVGANGTDRIFNLLPRPVGFRPIQRCGGYYVLDERPRTLFPNDSFSIVALSDGQYELEAPGHAHTGSLIYCEITSVSGPEGATFGFWDQDHSAVSDTPSVVLPTNQASGNPRFAVSEGGDFETEDPLGHIHSRSWTADKPGDYYIGLRLIDISTTGPDGGPWHSPSQIYIYHFKAGPDFKLSGMQSEGSGFVLSWQSQMGIWKTDPNQTGVVFNIERSVTMLPGSWQIIGTVTGTTDATATFTDLSPPGQQAFYRLGYLWSTR